MSSLEVQGVLWVPCPSSNLIERRVPGHLEDLQPLSGNGLDGPVDLAWVGMLIWVINRTNSTISLFAPDGTRAGAPLSGNGLRQPIRIWRVPVTDLAGFVQPVPDDPATHVTLVHNAWPQDCSLFRDDGRSLGRGYPVPRSWTGRWES